VDVEFGPQAAEEYDEAIDWYLERGWVVLENFADEVARMSRITGENPRLWAEVEPGLRRAVLLGSKWSQPFRAEGCGRSRMVASIHGQPRIEFGAVEKRAELAGRDSGVVQECSGVERGYPKGGFKAPRSWVGACWGVL
jgi:plasmid stabilization system protein ParE